VCYFSGSPLYSRTFPLAGIPFLPLFLLFMRPAIWVSVIIFSMTLFLLGTSSSLWYSAKNYPKGHPTSCILDADLLLFNDLIVVPLQAFYSEVLFLDKELSVLVVLTFLHWFLRFASFFVLNSFFSLIEFHFPPPPTGPSGLKKTQALSPS